MWKRGIDKRRTTQDGPEISIRHLRLSTLSNAKARVTRGDAVRRLCPNVTQAGLPFSGGRYLGKLPRPFGA